MQGNMNLDYNLLGVHVYRYMGAIVRVHDGDTFLADIDLGFHIKRRMWLRLAGVDTPELDTEEGKQARAFVIDWLSDGKLLSEQVFQIETAVDNKGNEKTTFGRYVANVINAHGESLAEVLIAAGHGRPMKV